MLIRIGRLMSRVIGTVAAGFDPGDIMLLEGGVDALLIEGGTDRILLEPQ